jgi:uncharacterized protein YukE
MATGSHAEDIQAALRPTTASDIESSAELHAAFAWFKEMLPAKPGKYGEIYQRWTTHPAAKGGWAAKAWGPDDDRLLDELGGIHFGPLLADSQRFANLRGATEEMRLGAESMRSRLSDAWSGPAAQSAVDTFDQLGKAAASFRDTLNQFAAAVDLARTTTREAIVSVKESGIRPFDLPRGVELRREQIRRLDAAMAGLPPFPRPFSPEELRRPNTLDLNAGSWEKWWSNEVLNVLDAMCDSYANAIDPLRKLLTDTTTAITDSWSALDDVVKRLQANGNPFDGLKAAPPSGTTPSQAGPEKITVDDGQRRITVDHDAQGRLNVTVDHPGAAAPQPAPPPGGPGGSAPSGTGGGGGGGARVGGGGVGGGGGGGIGGGGVAGGAGAPAAQPLSPGTMAGAQPLGGQPEQQGHAAMPAGAAGGAPGGAPGGGGMPMGGMGGAGGGQGGDTERKASRWRTQGDLFDDAAPEVVPMVIGDVDPYENPKGRK